MENKDKYYTPTIEEFHVGFECELKNSSHPINFEWEKFKIIGVDDGKISGRLMDWNFYDSRNAILDESIRVKYLDQEDIESLGWKPIEEQIGDPIFYELYTKNKNLRMRWSYRNIYNHLMIISKHENITNTLFDGAIKNKSELIKLMQQLNIQNDK